MSMRGPFLQILEACIIIVEIPQLSPLNLIWAGLLLPNEVAQNVQLRDAEEILKK